MVTIDCSLNSAVVSLVKSQGKGFMLFHGDGKIVKFMYFRKSDSSALSPLQMTINVSFPQSNLGQKCILESVMNEFLFP